MAGFSLPVSWEFCRASFVGNLSTKSGSKPFGDLINILPRWCKVCCRQEMTVALSWAREEQEANTRADILQQNCIAGISAGEMNQEGESSCNAKPSQRPKPLFIICGWEHQTCASQTNQRARSLPWRTYNLCSWPCEMLQALPGRAEQFYLRIILVHLRRSRLSN